LAKEHSVSTVGKASVQVKDHVYSNGLCELFILSILTAVQLKMAHNPVLFILLTLALVLVTHADAIYTKNSPVLQVDSKSYDSLIARSNHTSV
jgi:hypothetical protein